MAHEPFQFGRREPDPATPDQSLPASAVKPEHLDLDREKALTVSWADGCISIYSIAYLRRMSPSAEARQLREQQASNPLTVLPASASRSGPLTAESAEMVGRYALRIRFSDGHDTGIYTWSYLREIDPGPAAADGLQS